MVDGAWFHSTIIQSGAGNWFFIHTDLFTNRFFGHTIPAGGREERKTACISKEGMPFLIICLESSVFLLSSKAIKRHKIQMSPMDTVYRWYPIYTLPRAEKKTDALLAKKGIVTYLPTYKTLKQWSDRKKWVEEVLFKSYLFVYISPKEYDLVVQSHGVVRFIYFSGKAASIPDQEMELLKNYLAGELDPEITFEHLAKGQKVKIIGGKLKGYEAELVSWQQQQRLVLRIDALGQSLLLRIPAADVETIGLIPNASPKEKGVG